MHTLQHLPLNMLRVDGSGIPIYVQLREQLLGAIGAGRLRPGERMPTMRQVAVALKIDLNTVKHAYDELERAGAITLLRGRGTFVAEVPPPIDRTMQGSRAASSAWRYRVRQKCRHSGRMNSHDSSRHQPAGGAFRLCFRRAGRADG